MKSILFVANVAKEHILKFHIPSIKKFKAEGWIVDIACSGDEAIPYCDNQYHMKWKRSPFTFKTFLGIKELRKIIKNNNYDVVYCHTPVGGMIGRIASRSARKKGTKVIYFSHGFHFYNGAPLINWLLYYPVEKILAKYTDKAITINKEDYENAVNRLKIKNVMLLDGIGIDLDLFSNIDVGASRKRIREELNIPQNAWVLIYLAELIPNKNQTMLLDAAKKVMLSHPNTYVILAGIDHYHGYIQKYAEKIGIKENFRYLGWRSDKEDLLVASDVCTPTSIREGFGLNLIEAMACGVPVVATDNRGHRTIIEDGVNGFLVGIGDSDAMAKRIVDVLDKHLIPAINRSYLTKFDEKVILDRIFDYVSK